MLSFRTEIEDPIVAKDIIELEKKIHLYRNGKIHEEGFRSLRLARGIYGQRQEGVQMIRIKLPFGRLTSQQLVRIAEVSDKYSTGRLHITTRQDIQIHHVSLERTPELWAELEKDQITLREACGNAVRNVTASDTAGIDPKEPFDVTPYAEAVFRYFLRNPICQELGRKFKIAFSSTDEDSALSFIHDLGFLAQMKQENGELRHGFRVLIAGGLGAQPRHADELCDFLPADKLIPLIESVLRIFDRHGERNRRAKARLKHLIQEIGLEAFQILIQQESKALANSTYPIKPEPAIAQARPKKDIPEALVQDAQSFEAWKKTNLLRQKQEGLYAIGIKVGLGDFSTDQARSLADLIRNYAGNEIRLTINQGILIRDVPEEALAYFFARLQEMHLADPGYNSTLDITSCPGTDTCNLGIASSTGLSRALEEVLRKEFPQYIHNKDLSIKISGCMNACGQHSIAQIGFYGMSVKHGELVIPAFQVLLGGGSEGRGRGRFADKVIKIPSKRGPAALRLLLQDYDTGIEGLETFVSYYDRMGKDYFYRLLKPLSILDKPEADLLVDWGHDEAYIKAIGIGECAGVVIDLVSTLLFESEEKIENAREALSMGRWADSIYHSYSALLNTAKAVLIGENIKTNTQAGIISDFDRYFVQSGLISLEGSFSDLIYQIREKEPSRTFAEAYVQSAAAFYHSIDQLRTNALKNAQ